MKIEIKLYAGRIVAMGAALFSLQATATTSISSVVPSPTPSNSAFEARYLQLQAEASSRRAADKMNCNARAYSLVRTTIENSYPTYYCAYGVLQSVPQCKTPLSTSAPKCIYTPRPGAPGDETKTMSPGEAVDEVVQQIKSEYLVSMDEAEVFIPYDVRQKSPGKYLKGYFESLQKNGPAITRGDEIQNLPGSGLIAFTTPAGAAAVQDPSHERIIPLRLRGPLRFVHASALLFLRDQALSHRYPLAVQDLNEKTKRQRQFLAEIIAKLPVTGFIDDNYFDVNGAQAGQLGCKVYGNTRLNIIDAHTITLGDALVSLGGRGKNDDEKGAETFISYWYKVSGLAPYAPPTTSVDPLDAPALKFTKNHLVTCEKNLGIENLPDLKKSAPYFLTEVVQNYLHYTARDLRAFHWFTSSRVTQDPREMIDAYDPRITGYLQSHWQKFYFENNHSDAAGNGLYFSLTPTATYGFGTMGIDMAIPKGTAFVNLFNVRSFSAEAKAELNALHCADVDNLLSVFATRNADCQNIARALARRLKVAFGLYYYGVVNGLPSVCTDPSTPTWAMVAFDPELLSPAHVTVVNTAQPNTSQFNEEQKMVAEYFRQRDNALNSLHAQPQPLVDAAAFSKWVNSQILGCGMGSDWVKSW